jgi:eukaryotic-like serine/threonine-protein kinase
VSIDTQLVKVIFLEALECERSGERAVMLKFRCDGNSELRKRVEALLQAHDHPEVLPGAASGVGGVASAPYVSGTVIAGRYTLVEQIGEGGMGTVWAAQQTDPVRRRVALKLIKPGMDSRRVLARFEIERQALALMDHVGIAKVFDGGLTEQGRPFFAMEYVEGVPITEYCRQQRVPLAARLRLFVQVCQAIQHAHQKGIIHRDLKPSNVLVRQEDGNSLAKVIDFGLAKAMREPLTEHSLDTAHAFTVGTPRYMSPEQAEDRNPDVDTRSDVYALGVILYEMLTGDTPLLAEQFKLASWQEILRMVKEQEPERPSARLAASEDLPRIATDLGMEPARLLRAVHGELDWIVMKALEKSPARRFASSNDLARDVERYLNDQPVEARPPSAAYRFAKFARRNRAILTTAVLVAATVVMGLIASISQAIRATRAEHLASSARAAEANQREIADGRRQDAEERRAQTEGSVRQALNSTDEFFVAISRSDLWHDSAMQPMRAEFLAAALKYYREFADHFADDDALRDPLAWAHVRVGNLINETGSKEQAIAELRKGAELYAQLARDQPDIPAHRINLARAYFALGRVERRAFRLADSETSFKRSLETSRRLADEHPDDAERWADVARALAALGNVQHAAERLAESEASFGQALVILQRISQQHPETIQYRVDLADAQYRLGPVYRMQGRLDGATSALHSALEIYEPLARANHGTRQHWQGVAGTHYRLGEVERAAGHLDPAASSYRRGLDIYESLVGQYPANPLFHRGVGDGHYNLGLLHSAARRSEQARESWERAEASYRKR